MFCCHCDKACCSHHDWSNDCVGDHYYNIHMCLECSDKYGQLCPSCFDSDDEDDDSDEGEECGDETF